MENEKFNCYSYLKKQPLLEKLLFDNELTSKDFFSKECYDKGETIIDYSESPAEAFFPISGSVYEEYRNVRGDVVLISVIAPYELFGVIAEETENFRKSRLFANSHCEVIKISKEGVSYILNNFPEIRLFFEKNTIEYLKKNEAAEFLLEFFPNISRQSFLNIHSHTEWVNIKGGKTLFSENDYSDCIYYVVSGRLQAFKKNSLREDIIIGNIYPGETIGELGIFTDKNRMATVIANRDSLLLKINKTFFENEVGFAGNVSKKVFEQFLERSANYENRSKVEKVITIFAASESEVCRRMVSELLNRLKTLSRTVVLTLERAEKELLLPRESIKEENWHTSLQLYLCSWLSKYEQQYDYIILMGERSEKRWNRYCTSNCDEICLIVDAEHSPHDREEISRYYQPDTLVNQSIRIILCQSKNKFITKNIFKWYKSSPHIKLHHYVREEEMRSDSFRIARFISHKALGLVLGGGGIRSMAHLGILKALDECRITIDYIAGCSGGSKIAFHYAMGQSIDECIESAIEALKGARLNYTFPFLSFTSGRSYKQSLEKAFGDKHIEESLIPYFALSCNMSDATPYIHKSGLAVDAILASSSIPGIMPPIVIDGKVLVDGGVLSILPVELMKKELKGSIVIASDVTRTSHLENVYYSGYGEPGWKLFLQSYFRPDLVKMPNVIQILLRAGELASIYHSKTTRSEKKADIFLKPPVDHFETFDFKQGPVIVDIGYEYTKSVLNSTNLNNIIPYYNFY